MEVLLPVAFTPALPASISFTSSNIMRSQKRHQRFLQFRRRATVTSTAHRASLADASQETIRFESLFSEPSDATVLTPQNETVSLIDHVQSRNAVGETVLLGWLRHFGCSLCKKQTADWISIQSQLENCGNVCMTLIGNGSTQHALDFIEETSWNGYLFTDPERRTYDTLQFRAGLLTTFNLPALVKVISSFREGNKQTWKRIPTDAFQQGGAVLVDKTGIVRIFHADAFAGDHFEKDQLVRAICATVK